MGVTLTQQRNMFENYIRNNEIDKAVTMLCKMAVTSAREGNFDQADTYRDLLYEVDDSALVAIMKVNEFIEGEKRRLRKSNLEYPWPDVFKQLSPEESKAFFHALQNTTLDDDHIVLQQGKPNDRLYLIDHGMLKVVFKGGHHETLIQHLGRGNIFGEDTFFSINVCTSSVVTLSTAHLKFLDHYRLKRLEENFPVIADSLARICRDSRQAYDYLQEKKIDRRAAKRIHLKCKVAVQLLTAESRHPMQRTLTADLWDVSKHGLCFHMASKNQEEIRRLLGRSLGVRIKLDVDGQPKVAVVTGVVQGVQNHDVQHYSVHMQLNPPFSDAALATIERIAALCGQAA